MTQPSNRDLELLSAYLDGQLSQRDVTTLESRMATDPELRTVYDGLRQTRALLRQLPSRRAPRNFRLTPQMVGAKPAQTRAFPVFRLVSVLTSLLLFIGYAINLSTTPIPLGAAPAAMPAPTEGLAYSSGMAATEVTGTPQTESSIAPKMSVVATDEPIPTENATTAMDTFMTTEIPVAPSDAAPENQNNAARTMAVDSYAAPMFPIHPGWLLGLLGIALFSGVGAYAARWRASNQKIGPKQILAFILVGCIVILLLWGIYWMFTLQ